MERYKVDRGLLSRSVGEKGTFTYAITEVCIEYRVMENGKEVGQKEVVSSHGQNE